MIETRATISRRKVVKTGAALAGLALLKSVSSPARAAADEITIMTWETYHDDNWLSEWTAKSGVKVNAVRIGSNDETYEKLRSGAVNADMVIIDTSSIPRFLKAGLIAPVDPSRIPNTAEIAAGLHWPACTTIDGAVRAIPYNWGTQPLMYNMEAVRPKPASWQVLWDQHFAGKVVMPDDAYTVWPMMALAINAKDPYNLSDAEFGKCIDLFKRLRPQLRVLASGFADATAIFATGDGELGYCENISSVFQLQGEGKPFDYAFPDEGTPAWVDCAVPTPAGANRKVVYDFINEMLTPRWQARFIQSSMNNGILDLTAATGAGVPQDVLRKTNIPDQANPAFWKKMVMMQNPENIDRRLDIWNSFKAGTL